MREDQIKCIGQTIERSI